MSPEIPEEAGPLGALEGLLLGRPHRHRRLRILRFLISLIFLLLFVLLLLFPTSLGCTPVRARIIGVLLLPFQVIACRPTSTGAIKLRSRDPRDKPVIETNFLASAEDRAALRQGLRLAEKVALSGEIAYAGGGLKRVYPVPALGPLQDLADAELDRYVRETVHTANAISGTLSMGTAPDTSAVDLQLRVHGTQGLRVVDSSVMPSLPGGQTCAHTYAIAEKAAGIILQTK